MAWRYQEFEYGKPWLITGSDVQIRLPGPDGLEYTIIMKAVSGSFRVDLTKSLDTELAEILADGE